jgi:hypothetical protein
MAATIPAAKALLSRKSNIPAGTAKSKRRCSPSTFWSMARSMVDDSIA